MLAAGCLLIARGLPMARRIDLAERIEPYLDRPAAPSRLLLGSPEPWRLGQLLDPVTARVAGQVDRLLGGTESVRSRLQRAGLSEDIEGFRIQQVLWGIGAAVLTATLGSLLWWSRGASLTALVVVVASSALGGVMARDQLLTRAAIRRERRVMAEFPAVAELLALSVTAGEGTAQALERVARLSRGELSAELDLCLARVRTGTSLPDALQGLSHRTASPPITRFVDGLIIAIQRGTPLGEVLRAQAQDARESARQALIEEGGKREIAMMVPVVFLVLPVTVLFAVYPGISLLRFAV
jgi:tight adherence protein C